MRHSQSLLFGLFETQMHGAHAAKRQKHIFRPRAHGKKIIGVAQPLPMAFIGRHHAQQQIGMAAQIFGACFNRNIDAMLMGREEQRGSPCIVHDHRDVSLVSLGSDGGNILDFKALRARAFGKDSTRIVLK